MNPERGREGTQRASASYGINERGIKYKVTVVPRTQLIIITA